MGEPGAAADATQEAFIAAYKSLRSFRGGSFKSWLLRIVTNACYDELRRHRRRPQTSLDQMTEEGDSFPELAGDAPNPEDERQLIELIQAVKQCLDQLPDDQRVVAVLSDVEGYNYQEIAEIVSTTLGTVKSRLSRARARLRDCLQGYGELLPASYRLT
jgi:RNA polymerase sigma-70 factor (ECF subfamily)